jgi:arylformamidase
MPRTARPATPAVDFDAATSLALHLDFTSPHPQHFGAPPASSAPFATGGFEGAVARGASCNCQRISLIPHCHGTHTESACHLTLQQFPLQQIVPFGPVSALLLTVRPMACSATDEDSLPAPRGADRLVTRSAMLDVWPRNGAAPKALMLRTGTRWEDPAPPCVSRQLMQELVARGIEHLVTDLPSVDRLEDDGRLTTHRIFFGLPAHSTDLAEAGRAQCTITELAHFPDTLQDGACALQLQIPSFSGDAVPSRPLHLPLLLT